MPQVATTLFARHFHASHAESIVFVLFDFAFFNFFVERWPPAARVEFASGREKHFATPRAKVFTFVGGVCVLTGECSFRSFLSKDVILLGSKDASPFFFGLGKCVFVHVIQILRRARRNVTRPTTT